MINKNTTYNINHQTNIDEPLSDYLIKELESIYPDNPNKDGYLLFIRGPDLEFHELFCNPIKSKEKAIQTIIKFFEGYGIHFCERGGWKLFLLPVHQDSSILLGIPNDLGKESKCFDINLEEYRENNKTRRFIREINQ